MACCKVVDDHFQKCPLKEEVRNDIVNEDNCCGLCVTAFPSLSSPVTHLNKHCTQKEVLTGAPPLHVKRSLSHPQQSQSQFRREDPHGYNYFTLCLESFFSCSIVLNFPPVLLFFLMYFNCGNRFFLPPSIEMSRWQRTRCEYLKKAKYVFCT